MSLLGDTFVLASEPSLKHMEKIEITIIGAGVVGLAIAFELSKEYKDIFVLERHPAFGQETSSRNSEVIHAGIYYPKDSLKHATCMEGRRLLYDFCIGQNIAHKKIGKFIVAIDKNELSELEALYKHGLDNGVSDLRLLSREELKKSEPNVEAVAAIYSPSTGIIDSHSLMKNFQGLAQSCGAQFAYGAELTAVKKCKEGFLLTVRESKGENFSFLSRVVINCAGLNSDKVAGMAGIEKEEYRLKYCKGDYFRVHNNKGKYIKSLIYPVPKKDRAGLGIHATLDLSGSLRLGPDDEYVDKITYEVNAAKAKAFYESVRTFLPFIELGDLSPDTSGIRPKLQRPGEAFRDFIIKDEADNGLEGFINLIGIESPGLTSSLSIAAMVRKIVNTSL